MDRHSHTKATLKRTASAKRDVSFLAVGEAEAAEAEGKVEKFHHDINVMMEFVAIRGHHKCIIVVDLIVPN